MPDRAVLGLSAASGSIRQAGRRRPLPRSPSIRFMDIGSAADWTAAIFTGGGLAAAVSQLRMGRIEAQQERIREHEAEEECREAMASAVGVTACWQPGPDGGPLPGHDGYTPVATTVMNASPYPISNAVLVLAADYPHEIVIGTILPGQELVDTNKVKRREVVFGELTGGATLLFTDTYGNHWARSTDSLERREQAARIC